MSILSDEITGDPEGLGYAAMTDLEAANAMNVVNRPRNRTSMTGSELLSNQNSADYNALSDTKKDNWLSLCGVDSIDPFGSAVQVVIDIWGAGSTTIANLQTARVEAVSRAQELGITVNEGDVNHARVI